MSGFGPSPFDRRQQPVPLEYSAAGNPALISFFNAVYAWMAAGLALTAVIAWWLSQNPSLMVRMMSSGLIIVLFIAQIALVWTISAAVHRISATVATAMFLLYAALMGVTLSVIFLRYTNASIAAAFIACAVMFGVMSVYGMVTQRDLTGLGKLLFMGLIGLVVASVVNIFVHSNGMAWIISYAGVAIFVGLTAYDTQRLKAVALSLQNDAAMSARMSVNGALMLYLDFINLFLFLLRFMGKQRN